jgi:hypothetical protein
MFEQTELCLIGTPADKRNLEVLAVDCSARVPRSRAVACCDTGVERRAGATSTARERPPARARGLRVAHALATDEERDLTQSGVSRWVR